MHLCIAKDAWRKVKDAGIKPRWVFAHPDLLKAMPDASLHYRGIALLSRKRVGEIAGSVDTWERSPDRARVSEDKALKVCRLYNAVISAILLDSTQWTLDDSYRHILATIGITEDGAMRNIIGHEAPVDCKNFLVAGVVTPTMRSRLEEMQYEGDFDIERLLHDDDAWVKFLNEIFHYALRLTEMVAEP